MCEKAARPRPMMTKVRLASKFTEANDLYRKHIRPGIPRIRDECAYAGGLHALLIGSTGIGPPPRHSTFVLEVDSRFRNPFQLQPRRTASRSVQGYRFLLGIHLFSLVHASSRPTYSSIATPRRLQTIFATRLTTRHHSQPKQAQPVPILLRHVQPEPSSGLFGTDRRPGRERADQHAAAARSAKGEEAAAATGTEEGKEGQTRCAGERSAGVEPSSRVL
jgi:hypothetical protein